ncbi:MAG TPA: DUF1761 domain-containing protein [Flavobacteriales bacterium]|nr:DUF1761 domain-containing protein [Flavobacteriales bacterium]
MNHPAILVCAISIFLLGAPWYSKVLFLNPWARANGIDPNAPRPKGAKHPAQVYGIAFVMAWVAAYAFAMLVGPAPGLHHALHTGLLCGGGIAATSFAINYQFANKSTVLILIDGGYHLVQFTLYGLILGLWH